MSGNVDDYRVESFTWVQVGDFALTMGFEMNNLNALMLLLVTLVSFLVNIYSKGYMQDDERSMYFMRYISLFTFSMLALVISENLLQLYIFWELVGRMFLLADRFLVFQARSKSGRQKSVYRNPDRRCRSVYRHLVAVLVRAESCA